MYKYYCLQNRVAGRKLAAWHHYGDSKTVLTGLRASRCLMDAEPKGRREQRTVSWQCELLLSSRTQLVSQRITDSLSRPPEGPLVTSTSLRMATAWRPRPCAISSKIGLTQKSWSPLTDP